MTFRGDIPEFDPAESMEDSASDLYALLGLMPRTFRKKYEKFQVGSLGWTYVDDNDEFVLLLHFLDMIRGRRGVGPETLKKIVRDYCGTEMLEDDTSPAHTYAQALLASKEARFDLREPGRW